MPHSNGDNHRHSATMTALRYFSCAMRSRRRVHRRFPAKATLGSRARRSGPESADRLIVLRHRSVACCQACHQFVISTDENTSIQARRRRHPTHTCRPRTAMGIEHEYCRCGARTHIAALEVHKTPESLVVAEPNTDCALRTFGRAGDDAPPTTMRAVCSGPSTTVPLIVDPERYNACRACRIAIRNWCSFTHQSTPVG